MVNGEENAALEVDSGDGIANPLLVDIDDDETDCETDSELEGWLEDEEGVRINADEEPMEGETTRLGGDDEGGTTGGVKGDEEGGTTGGMRGNEEGGTSGGRRGDEEGDEDQDVEGNGEDDIPAPTVGMEFDSALHLVSYLHRFGHANGFQIRIRSSDLKRFKEGSNCCNSEVPQASKHVHRTGQKGDEEHYGQYLKLRLVCTKAGVHKPLKPDKPSHSVRTNCMFRVNGRKSSESEYWAVTKVNLYHNHDLEKTNSRFLPRYRKITKEDELIILKNDMAGVRIASNYHTFVVHYGGFAGVPFTERDMRNKIRTDSKRALPDGDFTAMERHFKEMRLRSPNFYYEYDTDENDRLVNVFWADERSIAAAKEFGDIVSFDNTYVTNRYRMPFAPFIAFNHHG